MEVTAAFGVTKQVPKSLLPLHLKAHVKPIDLEKLVALENKTPECREFLLHALGWLRDGRRYGNIELKPRKPRFSIDRFKEMRGYKYKPLYGLPEGFVDAFVRTEPSKDPAHEHGLRLRPLFAPDANTDAATREMLQEMKMPTKGEIRDQGADKPELVVQFDMESYYDQFACSESVKRKLCFLGPDGKVYALERLPMGLRPACEVAQATTWFLLDFEMGKSVKLATCIDNIRFMGKRTEVVVAIRTFLERCRLVGAQLDKWPASDSDTDIAAMGERAGDFLGENYDYDHSTRKLTKRTGDKVVMIDEWVTRQGGQQLVMSARQLSVLMGMLFWTASVLSLPLCTYFHLLRDYRRVCSQAAKENDYDGARIPISQTSMKELRSWLDAALKNDPVSMRPKIFGEPSLNLVVDASGIGYCAIATTTFTDCQILSGSWPPDKKQKAMSSVWAEPEAIYLACLRFVRPTDKFVRVFTDHSPVVYAHRAGYAKGFNPNLLIERLTQTFPNTVFEIVHVKGECNPADRYSRLGEVTGEEKKLSEDEAGKLAMLAAEGRGQCPKDNVAAFTAHNKNPPSWYSLHPTEGFSLMCLSLVVVYPMIADTE